MLPLCLSCSSDDGWFAGRQQMEVVVVVGVGRLLSVPEPGELRRRRTWSDGRSSNGRTSGTPSTATLNHVYMVSVLELRCLQCSSKNLSHAGQNVLSRNKQRASKMTLSSRQIRANSKLRPFPDHLTSITQKTSYFLMRLCSCESKTCIKRLCSAIFGERWPDFMCSSVITCRQTGVRAATSLKKGAIKRNFLKRRRHHCFYYYCCYCCGERVALMNIK